jgi:hypothetical protein
MESGISPYRRLVFVMIDGANYEAMRDFMASGDLPGLSQLAEEGGGLKKAVTCFPSTTGPAYVPYLMGLFPGTANIPGYRWLSRSAYSTGARWTRPAVASYSGLEGANFDLDLPAGSPTWFDFFGSHKNVINMLTRGCDPADNITRAIKPLVYIIGHYLDQWHLADRVAEEGLVAAVGAAPEFIACAFNGVDGHSHGSHPRSKKVFESYRTIDRAVRRARKVLREAGREEETLWVVGSDHGQSPTHTHIDVARKMEELGYPCLYYPRLWRQDAHCAEMVSGNGMTQVYFRNGSNWRERMPWEEIAARQVPDALTAIEGIDLVAGLGSDGATFVQTAAGQGRISWQDGLCTYEPRGEDPFGCGPFSGLDADALLNRTFESARPDALLQLSQLFRAERSGDLFVSAREGFDLRARWELPEHRSTHGALVAPQMHVPVIINHPLAADKFRTVDVFPTVLRHMGKEPSQGIDGVARA